MSAFVVSKAHIDALVRLAQVYNVRAGRIDPMQGGDEAGAALLNECVQSVQYRYPDDKPEQLPGPVNAYWRQPYSYSPLRGRVPSPIEGLKLISCYEYQSCEHPGWESSGAKQFCEALRDTLIGTLPGYDEAPWEWEEAPHA